jgi:hypothetical protein
LKLIIGEIAEAYGACAPTAIRYVRIDPGWTVVIVTLLPDEYPCATSCHRFSDGIH